MTEERANDLVIIINILIVFAVAWNVKPYLSHSEEKLYQPYSQPPLVQNTLWQQSCGECPLAYPPATLPQRSWDRLFAEQGNHFDEELGLSEGDVVVLLSYARANSAEHVERELSFRTRQSLTASDTPLRITETPYWQQTHDGIDGAVWHQENVKGRLTSAACHLDAEQGGFSNGAMRLPQ